MDGNYNKFRKATFGGFNRKDVIDYIEKIQNEFFDYKSETEKAVKKLRERIEELEKLTNVEVCCREIAETDSEDKIEPTDSASANEINIATDKLKNVTDELCRSLTDFIEKLSENSISVMLDIPLEEHMEEASAFGIGEERQEEPPDKVQSILNSASSIFTQSKRNEKAVLTEELSEIKDNKTITDILNSVSFIC